LSSFECDGNSPPTVEYKVHSLFGPVVASPPALERYPWNLGKPRFVWECSPSNSSEKLLDLKTQIVVAVVYFDQTLRTHCIETQLTRIVFKMWKYAHEAKQHVQDYMIANRTDLFIDETFEKVLVKNNRNINERL
jgi:hypothetical protein